MTTISTFQDLKRVLEENPEWLRELRQLILTDELMTLPARFEEYARSSSKRMDQIAEMIAENSRQIAENGKQIAENGRQIAEHSKQIAEIQKDIGWLKGESLENRLARTAYAKISDSIGPGRARILRPESYTRVSQEFNDDLLEARVSGVITPSEYRRLLDTDAIIRAAFAGDRQPEFAYIVVEASFTVNLDDLDRVERSATALGKIFPDAPVRRAIYCVVISERLREQAERENAVVVLERNLPR